MGSRGQSGGTGRESGGLNGGRSNRLPLAGQTEFTNGDETSVKATIDAWEKRHTNDKIEHLLMVDQNGFATAYYSGDKGSVGFVHPTREEAARLVVTHSHPSAGNDRNNGGTFSDADIINHIDVGFAETRARAKEGTYVFRATENANPDGMKASLKRVRAESTYSTATQFVMEGAAKKYTSKSERMDVYLTERHKALQKAAKENGYYYALIPND